MDIRFDVDGDRFGHRSNWINAAKGEENVDPRIEQLEMLQDRVADDFDYVMDGIDRLGRENMLDEAIKLLNTLADTLNSAIGIIGGDFESSTSIESYSDDFEGLTDVGEAGPYYDEEPEGIEEEFIDEDEEL